jgi:hypothetical protein
MEIRVGDVYKSSGNRNYVYEVQEIGIEILLQPIRIETGNKAGFDSYISKERFNKIMSLYHTPELPSLDELL